MDIVEKLGNAGVVPVVVLDKAEDAVPRPCWLAAWM